MPRCHLRPTNERIYIVACTVGYHNRISLMGLSFSFENSVKTFSVLSWFYIQVHLIKVINFSVQGLSWAVDICSAYCSISSMETECLSFSHISAIPSTLTTSCSLTSVFFFNVKQVFFCLCLSYKRFFFSAFQSSTLHRHTLCLPNFLLSIADVFVWP